MRNPKRIPVIIAEISLLWEKNPDMRLCQLLHYVEGEVAKREHRPPSGDIFNLEDRIVLETLRELNKEENDIDLVEDDSSGILGTDDYLRDAHDPEQYP